MTFVMSAQVTAIKRKLLAFFRKAVLWKRHFVREPLKQNACLRHREGMAMYMAIHYIVRGADHD